MCGIFGIVNDGTERAAQTVLEGLKKLEYRGYDSWGVALLPSTGNSLLVEKHVGKIGSAVTTLPNGSIAIGHTRWATHGGVTDKNAHPHLDCTKTVSVIHNGIVENYQELKEKLLENNHQFVSETDTEVIAHLIEEKRKNLPLRNAVFEVFSMLSGSNAIGVLDLKEQTIIACRNGSPLVVGVGDKEYYIASDVTAFLKSTRMVHFLADGEAVEIQRNGVNLYDATNGKKKDLLLQKIDWDVEDAEKGGYPHFLLKEIVEQHITIPKTSKINETVLKTIADEVKGGKNIMFIGCGTAAYCGLAATYFFASHNVETRAFGAYEFLPFVPFVDKKTIVVAISQSGETADTIIAVKKAKANGAKIVGLINARGSTLERLSDYIVPVSAGPEIAVVSTKAFTSQLTTLYLLANMIAGEYEKAQQRVEAFGKTLKNWINEETTEKIIQLAKQLMDQEHAYLIGKHLNYPATLEFALKLKESSYFHAEAFAAGELKHGVIALIQKGTPCFMLGSNDDVKHEVLSSATELKARGGHIIGIAPFKAPEFDFHIQTPDAEDLTMLGNIIAGQLLGYYLGIGRGADPDKPRNLAKSVTVK